MNLQKAQNRYIDLKAKMDSGENLTGEEAAEMLEAQRALATIAEASGQTNAAKPTLADAQRFLKSKGVLPSSSIFANPTVILAGKVLGVLAIAGLSAFGGMKYEQRRASRRTARSTDELSLEHSNSPQSHPATSPDDGRLAANRMDNVVTHPTAGRRAAASA
jgi:hypothetical protein